MVQIYVITSAATVRATKMTISICRCTCVQMTELYANRKLNYFPVMHQRFLISPLIPITLINTTAQCNVESCADIWSGIAWSRELTHRIIDQGTGF